MAGSTTIVESNYVPVPRSTGSEPCRTNPDAFFPEDYNDTKELRAAKQACGGCNLKEWCLLWGLANATGLAKNGVIGGTTPKERKAFDKRLHQRLSEEEIARRFKRQYEALTRKGLAQ
ncbi:WhiB family transcriptional regulator (plasmid) [Actinacidiphila glaucinigra]|uniref:WhiB family transcriptional regulator n=1 Tax=Actinacidiphila glaucinigra TaxID=235986 RepID=UPI002DDA6893|nr:WhiB family transcriptional regulator [Actinacidiphila glaucinigra]WSD65862.1 WhiB family transcriptional regulator [Actinacidiphila glaucinigra]